MDFITMTNEQIDAKIKELNQTIEELYQAKETKRINRFNSLVSQVEQTLRELREEFPDCEWVVEVDTYDGCENIDLFSHSDIMDSYITKY